MVLAGGQEQLCAALILLLQPQARSVCVGQLAHGCEDERLQALDVFLRRQSAADPVQLAKLAVTAGCLFVELGDLALEHHVLHCHPKQLAQHRCRRIERRGERDIGVSRRRLVAWTDQDQRGLQDLNRHGERFALQT